MTGYRRTVLLLVSACVLVLPAIPATGQTPPTYPASLGALSQMAWGYPSMTCGDVSGSSNVWMRVA
jgi:hypothetical protein